MLRLLALLPLLLAGCASSGTTAEFDRRIGTYVGRPEADVVGAALGNDAGLIGAADLARVQASEA